MNSYLYVLLYNPFFDIINKSFEHKYYDETFYTSIVLWLNINQNH